MRRCDCLCIDGYYRVCAGKSPAWCPGYRNSFIYKGSIVNMNRSKTTVSVRVEIDRPDESGALPVPPSPCIQVCRLDEKQICLGCRRTLDEIVAWPRLSAEGKAALLDELAGRHP